MDEQQRSENIVTAALCLAIVIIIVLKVTGAITVSWVWLLAPIWMALGVGLILGFIFLGYLISQGIIRIIKENRKNERN